MKITINHVYVASGSRFGAVSTTGPSGTVYIIDTTGAWVREDDLDFILNLEMDCCDGRTAKPINRALPHPTKPKPEPIIIESEPVIVKKAKKKVEPKTSTTPEIEVEDETVTPKESKQEKEE